MNKLLFSLFLPMVAFAQPSEVVDQVVEVDLTWTAPTQNTDGTPLTDLAGYWIYWGTSPGVYSEKRHLPDPSAASMSISDATLAEDTLYYFSMTAVNAGGRESNYSNEVSFRTPDIPGIPNAPTNVQITVSFPQG